MTEILNQQTILKSKYNAMDYRVRTPLYTNRVQEFYTPYVKTNQFDKNTNLIFNQANTQDLVYDKVICGRPETEDKSRFNYAMDQYITKRYVDVSGQSIRNNELRIQPNRYTTPALNHKISSSLEQSFREYYSNDISKRKHTSYSNDTNRGIKKFDTSLFTPKGY